MVSVLVVSLFAPQVAAAKVVSEDWQDQDVVLSDEEISEPAVVIEDAPVAPRNENDAEAIVTEEELVIEPANNVAVASEEEFNNIADESDISPVAEEETVAEESGDEVVAELAVDEPFAEESADGDVIGDMEEQEHADDVEAAFAADESFETASTLTDSDLDENRGTSNPFSSSYFFATSTGNTANNTYSGENRISDNAFSNSAGIATTIQNSGNNVLIQSSTIVNVEFQ